MLLLVLCKAIKIAASCCRCQCAFYTTWPLLLGTSSLHRSAGTSSDHPATDRSAGSGCQRHPSRPASSGTGMTELNIVPPRRSTAIRPCSALNYSYRTGCSASTAASNCPCSTSCTHYKSADAEQPEQTTSIILYAATRCNAPGANLLLRLAVQDACSIALLWLAQRSR